MSSRLDGAINVRREQRLVCLSLRFYRVRMVMMPMMMMIMTKEVPIC